MTHTRAREMAENAHREPEPGCKNIFHEPLLFFLSMVYYQKVLESKVSSFQKRLQALSSGKSGLIEKQIRSETYQRSGQFRKSVHLDSPFTFKGRTLWQIVHFKKLSTFKDCPLLNASNFNGRSLSQTVSTQENPYPLHNSTFETISGLFSSSASKYFSELKLKISKTKFYFFFLITWYSNFLLRNNFL